jgi:hypothetical protein
MVSNMKLKLLIDMEETFIWSSYSAPYITTYHIGML